MILRQTLSRPIGGYWDGGLKSQFDWEIDPWKSREPSRVADGVVVVGSFEANHWFEVKAGKNEKATLVKVRRKLQNQLDKGYSEHGLTCTFEYIGNEE